jgi:hypothetical protein
MFAASASLQAPISRGGREHVIEIAGKVDIWRNGVFTCYQEVSLSHGSEISSGLTNQG